MLLPPPRSHDAEAGGLGLLWQAAKTLSVKIRPTTRAIRFCMVSPFEVRMLIALDVRKEVMSAKVHLNFEYVAVRDIPAYPSWLQLKPTIALGKRAQGGVNRKGKTAVTIDVCRYSTKSTKNWNTTRP